MHVAVEGGKPLLAVPVDVGGQPVAGLLDGGELHLKQTKYIDYSEPEIWRAVRRLASPS